MVLWQTNAVLWPLAFITGYLMGSILFAKILVKLIAKKDIESIGDKNPGAKNTMLNVGLGIGTLAGMLDILKTLGPMLIAFYAFRMDYVFVFLIAIGSLLGHLYPLYFGFRGGRGAASIIGFLIFFIPYAILGAAVIVALIYLIKFLLKEKFLISVTRMLMTTILVSVFLPHPVTVKVMILIIAGVALINRNNSASFKEWLRLLVQTVKK